MIALLSGTVVSVHPSAVILAAGGIGYHVYTTPSIIADVREGKEMTFHTYLHVREDELSLYGFATERERDFFTLLLSAPGVGPKSALGVLTIASVDTIIRAITSGDPTLLTKVSGIGKKTAERVVVELRERLEKTHPELAGQGNTVHADVVSALTGLGCSPSQAREIVRHLPENMENAEEGIKLALKMLGEKQSR